jgi:hypothetical protein
VTEAQITIIFIHLMSAIFGPSVWMTKVSIWNCVDFIFVLWLLSSLSANHCNLPISFLYPVPKISSFPMLYLYYIMTSYLSLFFILWSFGFGQTMCSFVGGYRHFRGTFCFPLHGSLKTYVSLQCMYQPTNYTL